MSLQDKYRKVFEDDFGREVLGDILLNKCSFGVTLNPDNKAQIGQYNVGVAILGQLGVFGPDTLKEVINSFLNIIPNKEEEKDEKANSLLGRGLDISD